MRKDLEYKTIKSARQYGISSVLFRNAVGSRIGVNATDMECLGLLYFNNISTPSELGKQTGLTSGATTAMLDRLEKAGLIERKPNPKDRRGTLISINENSRNTVGPMFAGMGIAQSKMLKSFSDKELETINKFLEQYSEIFEEERKKVK